MKYLILPFYIPSSKVSLKDEYILHDVAFSIYFELQFFKRSYFHLRDTWLVANSEYVDFI